MKREPSLIAHSFRALALVIMLVSLVAFSTVAYTAYADVSNVLDTVGNNTHTAAISSRTVVEGSGATVYLNVTLSNKGLYPIELSMACLPASGSGIACTSPSVTILPGQSQTLHLVMTIASYSQVLGGGLHVNGRVEAILEPFASINMTFDLGGLVAVGGA